MIASLELLGAAELVLLQIFPEEGREAITVVLVFLLLLGVGGIYAGIRSRRRGERLAEQPVVDPGDVTDGAVGIEGIARPADEQLESPTGEGEVIAYEIDTHEVKTRWEDKQAARDPRAGFEEQERVTNRYSSNDVVPFYVEGEEGAVLVDTGSAVSLGLPTKETITEKDDSPDPHLVVEIERTRRISLLEDGDEVFVFGEARSNDDERANAVVGRDDEFGKLLVSTKDRDTIVENYTKSAPIGIVLGTLAAATSLGLLVYEYVLA